MKRKIILIKHSTHTNSDKSKSDLLDGEMCERWGCDDLSCSRRYARVFTVSEGGTRHFSCRCNLHSLPCKQARDLNGLNACKMHDVVEKTHQGVRR